MRHQRLYFREFQLRMMKLADQLEARDLVRRDLVAANQKRPREEIALEQVIARSRSPLEFLMGLDLLRKHRDAPRTIAAHQTLHLVPTRFPHIDLDNLRVGNESLHLGMADKVIQSECVASFT